MAILLHATRATHDIPHLSLRKGARMYHVVSDLSGRAGSEELKTFVRGCGMRPEWIQYRGTYREHFDAHGMLAECLLARGARLVGNHELGLLLRAKRAAYAEGGTDEPQPPAPPDAILDAPLVSEQSEGFRWGPIAGVPVEEELHALGEVAGRDVLEVGCGTAARAPTLVRWGGRYTGLEDDLRLVEAARRRLIDVGVSARITLGSPQDLVPLSDDGFDLVFNADGAYDYVPHLPIALAAVARVLRPGGRCALMAVSPFFDGFTPGAPSDRSLVPIRSYFDRTPRRVAGRRALRYHRTVGDWIAAFGAAGLILTDALELEPSPREWEPGAGPEQPGWEQLAMLPYTMVWRAYKPA